MFIYVGELCRYLYNAPPSDRDRAHRIRLAVGNGLRPDIFAAFQARFGIRDLLEFYAATEGNVALFNFDSYPGAVGRLPGWAAEALPRFAPSPTTSTRTRRSATHKAAASNVRSTSPANCLAKSTTTRGNPPPNSTAIATPRRRGENPARRLQAGRRVVPHRRPAQAGRARLLSISSTASATPFAGRARTSRRPKSPSRSRPTPACWRRPSTASPRRGTRGAPAWRRWWSTMSRASILPACERCSPSACRLTRGRCSCASGRSST